MLKKIWQYLDGTLPNRGQSLVELVLVMPLLVILLAGLVEIGWFADKYITMVEVTRTAARTATTLQFDTSPIYWEDPETGLFRASDIGQLNTTNRQAWIDKYRNCNPEDPNASIGFYNFIGCVALQSMNPLRVSGFEPGNSITDDIIISAFTVAPDGDETVVLKRLPGNADECVLNSVEESLGFVWAGNWRNSKGCLGSEFTNEEVEKLMNLNGFELGIRPTDERRYLRPQGVVLVEIHWEHETLSQFVGFSPIVSPVFDILGMSTNIYTWAAFPLPQIERVTDD